MVHVDLDGWIDKLRKCEHLEEDELKTLCEMVRLSGKKRGGAVRAGAPRPLFAHPPHFSLSLPALITPSRPVRAQVKEILVEESNVQPVNSPVTVRNGWGG
jgi:hypothetical protein